MIKVQLKALPALALAAALIAASPLALAAAQRTFVASTGVDAGNLTCSLANPCRSFNVAMLQTLSGGEVIVLDTAGYGIVTITQSVSIIAPPGVYAGISVPAGNDGVTINGAGIIVVLQGLSINGTGGTNGISFAQGAELHVANCSIANMSRGISAAATGGKLYVTDTTIRDNTFQGILANGSVTAIAERSRIENNGSAGIQAIQGAAMSVRESVVGGNNSFGVFASAASGTTTRLTIDSSLLADNAAAGAGVNATDAGSLATLDMIRSTSTRSTGSSGAVSSATAPAVAVMTVAASLLSENNVYGIFAITNSTALANGNTIARNALGGLTGSAPAVLHTRSNNSGEQASPASGTTPIAGF